MGFYFETSLGHYFSGMAVGLTRNFAPGDPVNREERGSRSGREAKEWQLGSGHSHSDILACLVMPQ
jgi:hypothetical protein